MDTISLDVNRLPRHVGIIMDGNGRWAQRHKLKIAMGHRAGTEALREIIRNSSDIGIQVLTLYAFSTENWSRSKAEVDALMMLLLEFFQSEIDELDQKQVRILILGDKDGLPPAQRDALLRAEARTAHNTGLKLNIAVNYGSRAEIVRAARLLAQDVAAGVLAPQDIDEAALESRLYTAGDPPVDLLIRTSGEMRQSNFLLWQCAYAEFVFPTVLWPDFDLAAYHACIAAYQGRSRRFGGRAEA
ncbi:MAG: isoprenyl transferase [Candidatus Limiplasma sp.]|nr:isoprenyl transferase [Candidatus Limiplasma sp.]MEA5146654.1 isoprenyl transferase [Candidatus Limiplasma sp.]